MYYANPESTKILIKLYLPHNHNHEPAWNLDLVSTNQDNVKYKRKKLDVKLKTLIWIQCIPFCITLIMMKNTANACIHVQEMRGREIIIIRFMNTKYI